VLSIFYLPMVKDEGFGYGLPGHQPPLVPSAASMRAGSLRTFPPRRRKGAWAEWLQFPPSRESGTRAQRRAATGCVP
jgi:hypothetical protein